MLIYPFQRPREDDEWRSWLAARPSFGELVASGGPDSWPLVVPAHFVLRSTADGDIVLVHLTAHNPLFAAVEADPRVVLSVVGDAAYVPAGWRARPDVDPRTGVPTSYFTAVQLQCRAELVDDPADKASLLSAQLEHFEQAGAYVAPAVDGQHGELLGSIRALRLQVVEVRAKFSYDDHRSPAAQESVADRLEQRAQDSDVAAAAQQRRRIASAPERRVP